MNVPDLTECAVSYFRDNAIQFGMKSDRLQACYVLNPNNFTNQSFRVTDGNLVWHLKLTNIPENQKDLRRWEAHHEILEERYHAPVVEGWIELPNSPFAGLLLRHVAGVTADLKKPSVLLQNVMRTMDRLHGDKELAGRLMQEDGSIQTYADSFSSTWIRRFREDLKTVGADLPDFVTPDVFQWMCREVDNLDRMVKESPEFAFPASSAIHGDLAEYNILTVSDKEWHIIDWDDLSLGDPAIDYCTLLWPLMTNSGLKTAGASLPIPMHDPRFARRLIFCLRARLLDGVIDTLADYIECTVAPDSQDEVRAIKKREHEESLEFYRKRFCE